MGRLGAGADDDRRLVACRQQCLESGRFEPLQIVGHHQLGSTDRLHLHGSDQLQRAPREPRGLDVRLGDERTEAMGLPRASGTDHDVRAEHPGMLARDLFVLAGVPDSVDVGDGT